MRAISTRSTAADRFNYNGPGFNYLRTPNERINAFASARHEISAGTELFATVSYTNRSSATKGAPEPLCLGAGCGNRINDRFFISAANPYNPFGVDLSAVDGTLAFFGHRPLESGPRLFFQDVDTLFGTLGAGGELFSLPVGEARGSRRDRIPGPRRFLPPGPGRRTRRDGGHSLRTDRRPFRRRRVLR